MAKQQTSTPPTPKVQSTLGLMLEIADSCEMADFMAQFAVELSQQTSFQTFVHDFENNHGPKSGFAKCFEEGASDGKELAFFIAKLVLTGMLHGSIFGASDTLKRVGFWLADADQRLGVR